MNLHHVVGPRQVTVQYPDFQHFQSWEHPVNCLRPFDFCFLRVHNRPIYFFFIWLLLFFLFSHWFIRYLHKNPFLCAIIFSVFIFLVKLILFNILFILNWLINFIAIDNFVPIHVWLLFFHSLERKIPCLFHQTLLSTIIFQVFAFFSFCLNVCFFFNFETFNCLQRIQVSQLNDFFTVFTVKFNNDFFRNTNVEFPLPHKNLIFN